jgi:hypothetical protein
VIDTVEIDFTKALAFARAFASLGFSMLGVCIAFFGCEALETPPTLSAYHGNS